MYEIRALNMLAHGPEMHTMPNRSLEYRLSVTYPLNFWLCHLAWTRTKAKTRAGEPVRGARSAGLSPIAILLLLFVLFYAFGRFLDDILSTFCSIVRSIQVNPLFKSTRLNEPPGNQTKLSTIFILFRITLLSVPLHSPHCFAL